MTPERRRKIDAIVERVMAADGSERAGLIAQACGGDAALIAEAVEALRRADGATSTCGSAQSAPAVRFDDMSGRRVGQYELLRRVGKGGMGSVYAARRVDHQYRKLVAVKLVRPGMESDEVLRRFRNERQVLASLEHPNIARLLDGGSAEDGLPYLVMEFVEGTPIDQYCSTHRLSIPERLRLFCTMCAAVQYAHQNLVIHRDLKPSNIMVTGDGVPKLLDFGIAKLLRPEFAEEGGITRTVAQPYTLEYASPEQVRGEPITTASDVYSLGVVLYRMLTGRRPYAVDADTAPSMMRAILEEAPERPSVALGHATTGETDLGGDTALRASKKLRGDLDTIVLKALRKEPQRRYASVQHLAEDVGRHLNGMPVRAHRDTLRYRAGKFVRRHAPAVAAACIVVLALIVSTVVSLVYYRKATHAQHRAEARFNDVRELAHFVLFDFDKAISSGVTPARKAALERALEYLRRLEKDAGKDASLDAELVDGYLKVGDLQGNLSGANLGDSAAAKASYERALRIAEASHPRDPNRIAKAQIKLADMLAYSGARQEAVQRYRQAYALFEPQAASDPAAARTLMGLLRSIAFCEYQMGDYPGALRDYESLLSYGRKLADASPDDASARRELALGLTRVGEMQARTGDIQNGLPRMQEALGMYEQLAAASPESGSARRNIAMVCMLLGDVLAGSGKTTTATLYFQRAVDVSRSLAAVDPRNEQYRRDLHNGLGRLAEALAKSGRTVEATSLTREALSILRPLVNGAEASQYDLYQYAWILVASPLPDMRDPAAARPIAEKLVARTKSRDAGMLDLLARAYAGTGDYRGAADIEQQALALLPAGGKSDLRAELAANLSSFEAREKQSRSRAR